MFLVDLVANFGSREINVKAYTRIINGKAVPVKGGRRTVLAIRDALNDLRKITRDNNEGAYLMNPRTGKVGQYVQGGGDSVMPFANVVHTPGGKKYNSNIANNRYILHNHPNRNSLSTDDILNPHDSKGMIFAINNTGSVFRSTTNWNNIGGNAKYGMRDILRLPDATYNIGWILKDKIKDKSDIEFLKSHIHNLILKDRGIINYRTKLANVDKQLVNKYKPVIYNLLKADRKDSLMDYINKQMKNDIDLLR